MIGSTKLYILISVWLAFNFKVTVVWENKNFVVHFLRSFTIDLDEIQNDAAASWFVEAHAKFVLYK